MTKNEVTTKVELTIEEQPYIEMMQYAHEFSPDECSGVGLVERIEFNDGSITFNVTKVYLPNQTNTSGTTDIDDDELNKLNTKLVEDGEDTSLLKFHWHSHVDMSVFHSGTDDENYDEMQTGDYAVSLVVNKRYDMLGSVHLYKPLRINVLNIDVSPPSTVDLDEYVIAPELRKTIEANVKRVQDYEAEQNKNRVGYQYNGHCQKCHLGWYYCKCYEGTVVNRGTYGSGLASCDVLYALLAQGEKAGMITLFYDDDQVTIIGYMNNDNSESFEIESYLDYSMGTGAGGGTP